MGRILIELIVFHDIFTAICFLLHSTFRSLSLCMQNLQRLHAYYMGMWACASLVIQEETLVCTVVHRNRRSLKYNYCIGKETRDQPVYMVLKSVKIMSKVVWKKQFNFILFINLYVLYYHLLSMRRVSVLICWSKQHASVTSTI